MTNFDLHTHTNASDGELAPQTLIQRARERGVTCLAITDHDTVAAYRALVDRSTEGITLCHGIELSAHWHGRSIHIVGLNIDLGSNELHAAVETQHAARVARAELIAARLSKLGFEGALDGARAIAGNDNIGRPHFARYLVSIRAVRDVRHAFRKFLGHGKIGDLQRSWPSVATVTSWIRQARGTAVLAHPAHYKLTNAKLGILTDEFVGAGGEALEVISGKQSRDLTRKLADLAIAKKLLASTGSDFHRPGNSWSEVGAQTALPGHLTPVWDAW